MSQPTLEVYHPSDADLLGMVSEEAEKMSLRIDQLTHVLRTEKERHRRQMIAMHKHLSTADAQAKELRHQLIHTEAEAAELRAERDNLSHALRVQKGVGV
jgi:chromosome segregation ATPase